MNTSLLERKLTDCFDLIESKICFKPDPGAFFLSFDNEHQLYGLLKQANPKLKGIVDCLVLNKSRKRLYFLEVKNYRDPTHTPTSDCLVGQLIKKWKNSQLCLPAWLLEANSSILVAHLEMPHLPKDPMFLGIDLHSDLQTKLEQALLGTQVFVGDAGLMTGSGLPWSAWSYQTNACSSCK